MKTEEEIVQIQAYIMKKINNLRYGYTTLSRRDVTDILVGLGLNWIEWEMEKRKLKA